MVDQARADAYNSWWQFRNDSWSRLEEASARINSSRRRGKAIEVEMTDAVHEQCAALAPLEQFWAFPGHAASTSSGHMVASVPPQEQRHSSDHH